MAISFYARWIKFGNCRDFILVGKDAIAMASGIYIRFHEFGCRETRVERFDGGERGDGACCLAGLSVSRFCLALVWINKGVKTCRTSAGGTHFFRGREEVQSKDLGVRLSHNAKDKSVHRKRGRGWLLVLCVCWYRVSDWSRNLSRFLLATLELENGWTIDKNKRDERDKIWY